MRLTAADAPTPRLEPSNSNSVAANLAPSRRAGNFVSGPWATVAGGLWVTSRADRSSAVVGGNFNLASAYARRWWAAPAILASGFAAFIGGGGSTNHLSWPNQAEGNASDFGAIGGGLNNTAVNNYGTVAGGIGNSAGGGSAWWAAALTIMPVALIRRSSAASEMKSYGVGAFIGGGGYDGNTYQGNQAAGNASVIGGGIEQ